MVVYGRAGQGGEKDPNEEESDSARECTKVGGEEIQTIKEVYVRTMRGRFYG